MNHFWRDGLVQRGAFDLAVGNMDEMGDKDLFYVSLQTWLRCNHLFIAQNNLVLSVFSPVLIPIASLSTLYPELSDLL